MARSRTKSRKVKTDAELLVEKADAIGMPREQLQQGTYKIGDVKIVTGQRTETLRTIRNLASNKVDEWLMIGGTGFEEPSRRAYEHCLGLWEKAGGQSNLIAGYGQRIRHESSSPGWSQHEALSELALFKSRMPAHVWDVFENVARFDEPIGVAGSKMASNTPQQIASAKACVGFALSLIAMWRSL